MALGLQLNKRVRIDAKSTTQDAYGQPVEAWNEVCTVWASIRDLTGKQYQAAQATQNPTSSEVLIRFREGIEPAMRVAHGSDLYDIQAVLGTDNRTLTLMAVKGLSNG